MKCPKINPRGAVPQRLTALVLALALLAACGREDAPVGTAAPASSSAGTSSSATAALRVRPLTADAVPMAPPIAEQRRHEVAAPHGAKRQDEYYWIRDDARSNPDMLAYLKAENAYADAVMAPLAELEATIYAELVGRLKQDDSSVPYRYKDYWYYRRFEEGREYPIYARRKGDMDAPEEIMLDANQLARGHDFYQLVNWKVSPDQRVLAYLEDTVGRRQYMLRIKDLASGETRPVEIPGLASSLAWAADSKTVFYVENDPETLLTTRVRSHTLGTDASGDPLIYEELDNTFYMGVRDTRSEAYVCIELESTVSNESRCTEAAAPGEFKVLAPRLRDFEYSADHLGSRWVIRTNWNAENFKLMTVADSASGDRNDWSDLVPHDPEVFINDFELFDDFLAVGERSGGLTRIRIVNSGENNEGADGRTDYVAADELAYAMWLDINAEPGTHWLRYDYTSLTTPTTTYELDVATGERKLLKEQPVLGGFDKENYETERLWATARDGTEIPVSAVYRKGFVKDGTAALLQYGYGSYGASSDPEFERDMLSLLDRGMVYAVAHIRGGQEMGRHWYDDGKLLNKLNTFTDFIDVTDFLVEQGYAAPDRVAAAGGSAGGLLMGAVANMAPEKYRVIVSRVPFVDIVTTMLDASIPLTTNEYDEWGNPDEKIYYDYMLGYSPYDQIAAQDYPAMIVSTGLWDSQVQYYEPTKYVARLRARRTDDHPLVLRVEMEAGHGGQSGRFQRYHETAEQFAFVLNQLGVAE